MFTDPFVQLKIATQALEGAFTPVSPGEVFKVFGSQRLHTIVRLLFCGWINSGNTDDQQSQNRRTCPSTRVGFGRSYSARVPNYEAA